MLNRSINLKVLLPFISAFVVIISFAGLMKLFHIRINITPSMPIGLYRQVVSTEIRRGDIVAVCLPLAIEKIGLERGYLTKGNCPGGSISILKKIIAIPGDTVRLTTNEIIVNSKVYLAPQHSHSQSGTIIKQWVHNGLHKKIAGYWLYGSHSINRSWDSRYFGGVCIDNIQAITKPWLTWL